MTHGGLYVLPSPERLCDFYTYTILFIHIHGDGRYTYSRLAVVPYKHYSTLFLIRILIFMM